MEIVLLCANDGGNVLPRMETLAGWGWGRVGGGDSSGIRPSVLTGI